MVLDADTARLLTARAITVLNLLHSYDMEQASARCGGRAQQRRDRLLNIEQAAEKLGVKISWLYRRHRDFGFTVRHGKLLRFSELGIEDDIRKWTS
jgi:predicted DNA-binding transcriptional regulator AlpA